MDELRPTEYGGIAAIVVLLLGACVKAVTKLLETRNRNGRTKSDSAKAGRDEHRHERERSIMSDQAISLAGISENLANIRRDLGEIKLDLGRVFGRLDEFHGRISAVEAVLQKPPA